MRVITVTFERITKDWVVRMDEQDQARHNRKQVSIDASLAIAKENCPAKVVVYLKSGRIEEERVVDRKPIW